MEISCNIIRDLLPLYAEDMTSQDSNQLIHDHLCNCDGCTKFLDGMKKPSPIPVEANAEALRKVKKTIRRRRLISVMAAVMTLLAVASAVFTYMFSPFQLAKEQALDDFYIREDGAVVVDYAPCVVGRVMSGRDNNWYINQYSTRYDMWRAENRKPGEEAFGTDGIITEEERQRYESIEVYMGRWETADGKISSDSDIPGRDDDRVVQWESEKNWWYADPRGFGNDILLHDAGQPVPEKASAFNPVYPGIFFTGLAVALLMFLFRKKVNNAKAKELTVRLGILGISAAAAMLLVSSGWIFTTTMGIIDQYWGWMTGMNTLFFTLTALFWRQLYLLNQQDKTL